MMFIENKFKDKKKEMSNFCFNDSIYFNNNPVQQSNFKNNDKPSVTDNNSLKEFIFNKDNVIGEGHFGIVYCAKHKKLQNLVAIKDMKKDIRKNDKEFMLLKDLKGIIGIPNVINTFTTNTKKMVIQDLCGPSLDKLHLFCNNKFSDSTILEIGIRLIKVIKEIHSHGIIHRDIKPANICYGIFKEKSKGFYKSINLIDFGLGKKFELNKQKNQEKIRLGILLEL